MIRILFFLLILPFSGSVAAEQYLQIIHSNDLHSYYQGERSGKGGFARLTTLSRYLINSFDGVSLRVDAGDFADGTSYSIPDAGRMSFKLLDAMGIEAVVIGNHDYLHGIEALSANIRENKKTKFLAANLDRRAKDILGSSVVSSHIFLNEGLKVGVIGLSTPHILYQHQWRQGKLVKALNPLKREIRLLKKDGTDVILLVSHLGLEKDISIVGKISGVDAIIGGHSHAALTRPLFRPDREKQLIPIFQAGAHGLYLGQIILKIDEVGKVTLAKYRLHDVNSSLSEDPYVASLVQQQVFLRDQFIKRNGHGFESVSSLPLGGMRDGRPGVNTEWSKLFLSRVLDESQASLVIWSKAFHGEEIPAGPISSLDIIDNLPRTDESAHPWKFKEVFLRPMELKLLLRLVPLLPKSWGVTWAHAKENSSKVVMPEGILRALKGQFPWLKTAIIKDSQISIWEAAILAIPKV